MSRVHSYRTRPPRPGRVLALAAALAVAAIVALLFAGCGASPAPTSPNLLHAAGQVDSCAADLRDAPCISCIKARCCTQAKACTNGSKSCPCAFDCLKAGNARACAEACTGAEDKAMAVCTADACAAECPGGAR